MSSHVVFNGVVDGVKAELEAYWAKKLPRLRKFLVPYRTDLQEIDLAVYCHHQNPQRSWYEARAVIHLPTGSLAAEADDKDPHVALDRVVDTLVTEIKRHKEHVRRDWTYKRRTRRREELSAAGPLLQPKAEQGQPEAFLRVLRPLLAYVADHARRELRSLEEQDLLRPGEVTVADLLDEVLTRAWLQFADRPRHSSLEAWLSDLLHDALEAWIKREPPPHVEPEEKTGKARREAVPREEVWEWWAGVLVEKETFTVEDLVPDWKGTEAWDRLGLEEQFDRLLSVLAELPVAQRQALLLHALEHFEPVEIALLQDRPEDAVKADIEAARRTLQDRLLAGDQAQQAGKQAALPTAGN